MAEHKIVHLQKDDILKLCIPRIWSQSISEWIMIAIIAIIITLAATDAITLTPAILIVGLIVTIFIFNLNAGNRKREIPYEILEKAYSEAVTTKNLWLLEDYLKSLDKKKEVK